jgi:hypothetical protein
MPLACNLMIRYGMLPRIEGLRLHFINNQTPRLFSALAASSNMALKRDGRYRARPLALRYVPKSYS